MKKKEDTRRATQAHCVTLIDKQEEERARALAREEKNEPAMLLHHYTDEGESKSDGW